MNSFVQEEQSSANSFAQEERTTSGRSLMYKRKRRGSRTDPGAPTFSLSFVTLHRSRCPVRRHLVIIALSRDPSTCHLDG